MLDNRGLVRQTRPGAFVASMAIISVLSEGIDLSQLEQPFGFVDLVKK